MVYPVTMHSPPWRRSSTLLLVPLLGIALALRLWAALGAPATLQGDGVMYDELAWNLVSQGIYGLAGPDGRAAPMVVREPGLPGLLALVYAGAGHSPLAGRLAQALLGTATCGLAFLLGRRLLGSDRAGLLAAGFLALSTGPAFHVRGLLTETLAAFLLTAALALTLARVPRSWELGLAGGLLGWLVLSRFQYAPLVVLLGLLYLPTLPRARRGTLLWAAVGFLLVMSLWWGRNYATFGQWILARPYHVGKAYDPAAFVPEGYFRWLQTWVADEDHHGRFRFLVVPDPADVPPEVTADPRERARVERLLLAMRERGSGRLAEDLLTPEADAEFAELAALREEREGRLGFALLVGRRAWNLWVDLPARTGVLGLTLPDPASIRERGAAREAARGGLVALHWLQYPVMLLALLGVRARGRSLTWAILWVSVAWSTFFHAWLGPIESRCLLTTWPSTAILAAAGLLSLGQETGGREQEPVQT